MEPEKQVLSLFAEWRTLTEAEHDAILQGEWSALERHQLRKEQLKEALIEATEVWNRSQHTETLSAQREWRFRGVVDELILLESRNQEALHVQQERVRTELGRLDQASRNLRGVQRAYGGPCRSAWQSYS